MKKAIIYLCALLLPNLLWAQKLPSEQFVLWKVWASDSSALKSLGYGDYVFTSLDTVVLEGSDTDTVLFSVPRARGFFTVWVMADTANFPVKGVNHNHAIGASDSLTLSYRPKLSAGRSTGNPTTGFTYLKYLDWEAEIVYYESVTPPLAEFLEFYLSHIGAGDTSAVIIEFKWQ